jgi:N-acetylgalactosamine 4-sulfate 6-O-sulfotransferase
VDGSVGMMSSWPDFFGQSRVINYCLLPSVIPEILPKAKFIVVMREPLSMLYSLFWFTCTRFNQPVSREAQLKGPDIFHERIVAKIRHINSCLTVFPLVKCMSESGAIPIPFNPLMPECGGTGLNKALYFIHIRKWLSVIPRERFLFLTMEELSGNLNQTINRVWKFIGVNSFGVKESDKNKQTTVDYKNDPHLAMRNDTRELLKTFLHPYNQKLANLLGDRKFLWY